MIAISIFWLSLIVIAVAIRVPSFPFGEDQTEVLVDDSYKIVNGTPTDIKHHPYQAAIFFGSGFGGSGAIIDKKWILSEGILPAFASILKVGVGYTRLSEIETKYEIDKVVIHPDFTLGTENNISLLKLKKPLKFSKTIKKITIASGTPKNKTSVVISGWGSASSSSYQFTDSLKKAELYIIDQETCKSAYFSSLVSKTTFCAYKNNDVYTYYYDSGDPLVERNKIVGLTLIHSGYKIACVDANYCPTIVTDVTQFKEWIHGVIKNE